MRVQEDESSGDEDGQEDWGAMQRAKLRQRPDPSSKTAIIAHPSQPNRSAHLCMTTKQRLYIGGGCAASLPPVMLHRPCQPHLLQSNDLC